MSDSNELGKLGIVQLLAFFSPSEQVGGRRDYSIASYASFPCAPTLKGSHFPSLHSQTRGALLAGEQMWRGGRIVDKSLHCFCTLLSTTLLPDNATLFLRFKQIVILLKKEREFLTFQVLVEIGHNLSKLNC